MSLGFMTLAALALILVLGFTVYKKYIASLKTAPESNNEEIKNNLNEALMVRETQVN